MPRAPSSCANTNHPDKPNTRHPALNALQPKPDTNTPRILLYITQGSTLGYHHLDSKDCVTFAIAVNLEAER